MKGPGLRLDLDVRRVWRCEKCGRIARTPGQVTAQRCGCTEPPQWMHLEPPIKKEPFQAPVREHLPEPWEVETAVASKPATSVEFASTVAPAAATVGGVLPAVDRPDAASQAVVINEITTTEILTTEVTEIVPAAPVPEPAAPAADEFGSGIEDPPRNPNAT